VSGKKLEYVIAGYLRQVWDKNDRLYEGQHGFRQGNLSEIQVITVCQGTADFMDVGFGIGAIITVFSEAFDLVPRD
jgi:hypothetical protein